MHQGTVQESGTPLLGSEIALETMNLQNGSYQDEYVQEFGGKSPRDKLFRMRRKTDDEPTSRNTVTGWRFSALFAAAVTLAVLIGNVTIAGVFTSRVRAQGYTSNVAPISVGKCGDIKKLGIGIHLVINIVSTLLLGASNYCMQTISAPSRDDVDRAHAKGSWVDIGIPSLRNLWFIRNRRAFVWFCLGITSIPLHLVYNSIFFVSANNNLYRIWYADDSFARGAPFNETFFTQAIALGNVNADKVQDQLMHGDRYQNLTNDECINAYAKTLIEDRGNVILVMDIPENCSIFNDPFDLRLSEPGHSSHANCGNTSATSLYAVDNYNNNFSPETDPYITNWYYWICSQDDGAWKDQLGADPWKVHGIKVNYCLSEKLNSQCQLRVSLNLIYVVIAFNAVKLIIIILIATSHWINDEPLVTVGDAAASFIESPDPRTKGICLTSARDFRNNKLSEERSRTVYHPQRKRWFSAGSHFRWTIATLLCDSWAARLCLKDVGKSLFSQRFQFFMSFGIGTINPYTLIRNWKIPTDGDLAVAGTILLTNLPQLILSFIYLILNSLLTSMVAAAEWASFAHGSHEPLRVSFPRGAQKSAFFLELPYQYSIPMLVLSILMHWLISQGFFIAQIFER
ncbi:unnamed protein product [Clonostachys rhizophaga]|uniref:DUF6536 domain-containing protein n=1 Tax=Clonostachys rhizophaga TaxID=160324 RepID=A0A9N9YNX8_9HYPO|nr:unnamed protein product [Clonostachys rhizophaga]